MLPQNLTVLLDAYKVQKREAAMLQADHAHAVRLRAARKTKVQLEAIDAGLIDGKNEKIRTLQLEAAVLDDPDMLLLEDEVHDKKLMLERAKAEAASLDEEISLHRAFLYSQSGGLK